MDPSPSRGWLRRHRAAVLFGALLLAETVAALAVGKTPARIHKDEADIGIYMMRTGWVPAHQLPYRDVFQEYPPLGAYYLAIPRALADTERGYASVFYLMGALALAATFVLVVRALPLERRDAALVLACPSVLYYAINRYDALPALVFVATLLALVRGREAASAILFGVGCGVKWYALAALPLFVVLAGRRVRWLAIACGAGLVCCFHPLIYASPPQLWSSYSFHLDRGASPGSIYDVLLKSVPDLVRFDRPVKALLLALQFAPGLLAAGLALRRRVRPDDLRAVAALMFVSVAGFTTFAKFHSPQWQVWLAPMVALTATPGLVFPYVVSDVLAYTATPLVWNIHGPDSTAMSVISTLYYAITVYTMWLALRSRGQAPANQ